MGKRRTNWSILVSSNADLEVSWVSRRGRELTSTQRLNSGRRSPVDARAGIARSKSERCLKIIVMVVELRRNFGERAVA